MKIWRRLVRHALAIVTTLLVGAFLTATMMRLAPGFDVDAQQLDSRLSHESVEALRAQRNHNSNLARFYCDYLYAAAKGDFGHSLTLNRPVRELIAERFPTTARVVGLGLLEAWLLAFGLAFATVLWRWVVFDAVSASASTALLCIPSAVMALAVVLFRAPTHFAVALIVFPRIFRYARNVLRRSSEMPHVITALAKGVGRTRVLCCHVLPVSAAPLLSLTGVSVSIALSASVPVEALCGVPGIGQLAWQAALGRDLPLLVTLTVLVTFITLTANAISDVVNGGLSMNP